MNAREREAPDFLLPAVSVASSEHLYRKGPTILVFYDQVGCEF